MEGRVLSIQSHVVSGYVGNKSAVFPLQLLGFDVDALNSVQFSNHTGYKKYSGQILTDKELLDLTKVLSENDLDNYSHLLTGYIGSPSFLTEVCKHIQELKRKNPNIIYVCDPVMGDNGKLYVPEDLIKIYRDLVIPLATIVTPNLFEVELLTNIKINSETDIWKAINHLHGKGCQIVVISSAELSNNSNLLVLASSRKDGANTKLKMSFPKISYSFTGTGDLFAALLLAWIYKTNNLKESLEKTIASLQSVLKRTYEQGKERTCKHMELKLIQSKKDIEEPNVVYKAEFVD